MNSEDKKLLVDYITGSDIPLAPAMTRLGITEGLNITKVELSDTIKPCVTCHKWTDVDVMENDRCPRCDAILNPDNKPDGE